MKHTISIALLIVMLVSLAFGHPQRVDGPERPTRRTTTTTRAPTNPTTQTSDATFRTCFRNCPSTTQYNPVCGSNSVTYDNMGRLNCAVRCGLRDLTATFGGTCQPVT